jgi:ABC-2 type transport system permease protein
VEGSDGTFLNLFFLSALYGLFWVAVCYFVNLLNRSSVFNISFLVFIWLILSLVVPSISNQVAAMRYPINTEEISKSMRRIQLKDDDQDLQTVLKKFYAKYPRYSNPDTIATNLFSRAYVAQGQLSDLKGDSLLSEICDQMLQKQRFLEHIAWFNPSMYLQNEFANETNTNLNDYVNYLKKLQRFNEQLKTFYFEKIFTDDRMSPSYYKKLPMWK